MARQGYIPRLVDPLLDELLQSLPAVLLVGPRAAGKTTTAIRHGISVLRLDRPGQANAVRLDPDAALAAYDEPMVIDEWQLVPEVLGAVKRSVDDDPRPGRFVLTGSAAADLTAAGWPATGRVVRVPLWGLTAGELARSRSPGLLSTAFDGSLEKDVRLPAEVPDLRGYIELAFRSGFPEAALLQSVRPRSAWLASYVDHLVARDVPSAGATRDPARLRRYLRAVAANTAGIAEHKTLYDAAGITRETATAYDGLLQALFVIEHVPAWKAGQLGRLVSTPKRYLVEPALVAPLLGLEPRAVMRDADLLGRLVDTFVVAQLRPELTLFSPGLSFFHLREPHGRHEVDLLVEAADGRIVAIEVKASSAPTRDMARHLSWLRDQLGDRFVIGIVFHTGPRPLRLDKRILALPLCAIWG